MSGETGNADVPSLLAKVDELVVKQNQEEYSTDPDSPYKRIRAEVDTLLSRSLDQAGSDPSNLTAVADKALAIGSPVAVTASERLVAEKATAASYVKLARSLKAQVWAEGEVGNPEGATLKRAESAIRSAFKASHQPTMEMYAAFADIIEDRSLFTESHAAYLKYYELAKSQSDVSQVTDALRGLIRTSYSLQSFAECNHYFLTLTETGRATPWDWQLEAQREFEHGNYRIAGDDYVKAADDKYFWNNWCQAANAYSAAPDAQDSALETARACIKNGAGKKNSDNILASAHGIIASVLNGRGVYEEALSHAREAVVIDPNNAFHQHTLAESFSGLRRFQEAINAAKQAIRLSDGKYGWMHFTLGYAYFESENWQAARQSYEKAAELNPKDDSAAYNLALCLVKLGYYRDAALWFEEVLRRNPDHPKKQEILNRIQALRQ